MGVLFDRLTTDVRFEEGFNGCIHCGTCTAICPAASFFPYEPRELVDRIQTREDGEIEKLMKSDYIWYCGECMSCKTRCPRGNAPGLLIMALRSLSQDLGYFVESERGRQQLVVKRTVGEWIMNHGYCLYPPEMSLENHPELGPIWQWELDNLQTVMERAGGNFGGEGPGIFRKIPDESLQEIRKIFELSGGLERYEKIESFSAAWAREHGMDAGKGVGGDYFRQMNGGDE